jgi:hypothetical protein
MRVALITFGCLFLAGCVQKTAYDALQKRFDETAKELGETKDTLKKSEDQLSDLRAHRYEIFTTGGRTWRLDTMKGSSCVMLASDQDWKKVETHKQSCACEDFYRDEEKLLDGPNPDLTTPLSEKAKRLGCE